MDVAVGYDLENVCRNVRSVWPFSIMVVWPMFAIWQQDLFSNICKMCTMTFGVMTRCPTVQSSLSWDIS